MDRIDDSDASLARQLEEAWRDMVALQNKRNGRDAAAAFAAFERALDKSDEVKEKLTNSILAADLDKKFATELCLSIIGKETRAQHYMEKLKKYSVDNDTISTAGTIAIPSDTEESATVPGHHKPAQNSVGVAAKTVGRSNKRPHDTDSTPSQHNSSSKKPRRNPRSTGHDSVTSNNTDAEDTRQDSRTGIRTILASEVVATDFIFPHPKVGPGHYVIRCDRHKDESGHVHHFELPPWSNNRAVNHFRSAKPAAKCHKLADCLVLDKEDIVKQFGYRVVSSNGKDVATDWVARSNARLKAKKGPKAQKKAPAPAPAQTTTTKPPAPATPTPTAPTSAPAATTNRRAGASPIEYRDARRVPAVTHKPSPSCAWAPEADMGLDTASAGSGSGANLLQEMGPEITVIVDQAARMWVESQAVAGSSKGL